MILSAITYLALHRPLLFPALDEVLHDTVCFLQQPVEYEPHLPDAIILLDHRLVLVHNERDALEQRG